METSLPTVLIVEDDPDWRCLLFDTLICDYDVVATRGAESATRLIEQREFSAVILDIRLDEAREGDVAGLTLLGMLLKSRADRKRAPVTILVTGYSPLLVSQIRDFYKLGLCACINKTEFSREDLLSILADRLANQRESSMPGSADEPEPAGRGCI